MSCRRLPGQAARDVNVNRSRTPESTSTQAILAKAFRGELVPTEAEVARAEGRDYETAAQLLARIRAEVTIDETNRETKSYRYTRSSLSTCRRSPHSTTASSHGTSVDDGSASNSRKSSRRPASVCPARRTTGTKPPVYRAAPRSKKHAHRKGCPPTYYGFHDLRRAFATLNADRLTTHALQVLMRHRSYTTTQRYINMARQLNAAVEAIEVPDVLQLARSG